ncbi:glycosyltransferase [Reyranella sp. CPCC 100927]|nr:glycosyltransferase [Reyranella sp. CPCC 100927]
MTCTTRKASNTVQLEAGENVYCADGRYVAKTATPWLRLRFADCLPAGRWISLAYRASFFDPLARPIIRFVTPGGHDDRLAPAPLFGRATWIGPVPHDTQEILISPVNTAGPFGFEVDDCRPITRATLVTKALSRHPGRTLEAIALRCIGRRREAHRQLTITFGSTAFENYHAWRAERWRDFDPAGLDAPRTDWSQGPHVRIVVSVDDQHIAHLHALLDQLAQQPYPQWSVAAVAPTLPMPARHMADFDTAISSGRLRLFDANANVAALCSDLSGEDLIGVIDGSDRLPAYALAVLAEHAMRHAAASVFYGDDEAIDARGRYIDPRLKPDWSPTFQAAARYVGSALFVRRRWLAQRDVPRLGMLTDDDSGLGELLADVSVDDVEHIRRVILTRAIHPKRDTIHRTERSAGRSDNRRSNDLSTKRPRATIIIPSKDRADLLSACVRSLNMALTPDDEVVIVDNGSVEAKTQRLYEALTTDDRYRLIHRPGPFNFSFLCNEAAREARGTILVFLNNDVTARDGAWLEPLRSWASHSDIGAVGANLLYPSGRLQHGGVVIGLGGVAGHIDSGTPADDPGYLQRRLVPHEVAAVTAACLAVEKRKFDAVDGFDAENLPVELNDIDLCLRLAERRWRTIFTPQSVLVHHESASRGRSTPDDERYTREWAFFRRRWGSCPRGDFAFHTALSLMSIRTALE